MSAQERLTIDELAQATGLTARNVRSYQSRGLIPPPQVHGRTGYYSGEHVARLQLIREMQARGFNLAAIAHLVEQTDRGGDDALGFTRSLMTPFETEAPEVLRQQELVSRLGGSVEPTLLRSAEKLGLVVSLGEGRFEVPSPTLLAAGERLLGLGVPLDAALEIMAKLRRDTQHVAAAFVRLFVELIWTPFDKAGRPEADWPRVRAALDELRPLASEALLASFQPAMTRAVEAAFGRELDRGRARARWG